MTFDLEGFRTARFSVPGSSRDELPPCCSNCIYLAVDEATVCFCDASYYFCAYGWPDKLTDIAVPCLPEL
jgi:hypothetical protein